MAADGRSGWHIGFSGAYSNWLFALLVLVSAMATAAQRAFEVNDLFELEDVGSYYGGPYSFSQDGRKFAFTRVRAKKTLTNHTWEFLWGNAGGDVWVQLHSTDAPVNITHGATDGSGWWAPQWSPDGEKLALLSTRGGNVCVWIWEIETRQLRQLSQRGNALEEAALERPYVWVDNQHLLYPALPVGEQPRGMKVEWQTPLIAAREWPKVLKGEEATANVLESGVQGDLSKHPQDDLLLLDVTTGNERVVAHGATRSWQVSPNRQTIAFTRQHSVYLPKPEEKLPSDFSGVATLEIARLDGKPARIHGEVSWDVLTDSVRWSPNGTELAFLGYTRERGQPPRLYRVNIATQELVVRTLDGLDPAPVVGESAGIEWTDQRERVVYAAKVAGDGRADVTVRRDWWLINRQGTARCLTAKMKEAPRRLWPADGRREFFGVADGKIWRIDPSTDKVTDLTSKFEHEVKNIVWPSMTMAGTDQYRIPGRTYNQLVFSVRHGESESLELLDLRSGAIDAVPSPTPRAQLSAYEPLTHTGIFYAADRDGLEIWRTTVPSGSPQVLATANTFLHNIAESEYKSFEYTSLNGEKLKGWLLLPHHYQPGRRYPTLTRVYPGTIYDDQPPSQMGIDSSTSLNFQIAAGHGYVVLLPSMPLSPEGVPDDPMPRLAEGVLPAVDKAVEMGIADPERLFLMGQSFGGYAAYGLVTQTQRFKAVVSLAGLSDFISLYSVFDARDRYTDHPQEHLLMAALLESAQMRMGNPPWKDLGRYIRNSPVFFVDRVRTPVLIIQGDMDYVALQQGEEFFNSLYRQGKRAEFVRYWGEGHVLESPANVRDMWQRIFAWFERFGPAPAF